MLPMVSLIVPARNEEKVIRKCIDSLVKQDYPKERLEIIVAIDGSTDRTTEIARSYGKRIRLILAKPKKCKGDALNNAIPKAKGEIIGIYDADCIVDKNAVKEVSKHFSDNKIAAVVGNVKSYNKNQNLITRTLALETSFMGSMENLFSSFGFNPNVFGKNLFIRKKILKAMGYFDIDTFLEDAEMSIKLKKYQYKTVFEPKCIVWQEEPQSLRKFIKQRTRWVRGGLRMAKYKRSTTKNFISIILHGLYFYLPPLGFLITILFILTSYFGISTAVILSPLAFFLLGTLLLVYSRIKLKEPLVDLIYFPLWLILSNLHVFLLIGAFYDEALSKKLSWNSVRNAEEKNL